MSYIPNIGIDAYALVVSFIRQQACDKYIHLLSSVLFSVKQATSRGVFVYGHMTHRGLKMISRRHAESVGVVYAIYASKVNPSDAFYDYHIIASFRKMPASLVTYMLGKNPQKLPEMFTAFTKYLEYIVNNSECLRRYLVPATIGSIIRTCDGRANLTDFLKYLGHELMPFDHVFRAVKHHKLFKGTIIDGVPLKKFITLTEEDMDHLLIVGSITLTNFYVMKRKHSYDPKPEVCDLAAVRIFRYDGHTTTISRIRRFMRYLSPAIAQPYMIEMKKLLKKYMKYHRHEQWYREFAASIGVTLDDDNRPVFF